MARESLARIKRTPKRILSGPRHHRPFTNTLVWQIIYTTWYQPYILLYKYIPINVPPHLSSPTHSSPSYNIFVGSLLWRRSCKHLASRPVATRLAGRRRHHAKVLNMLKAKFRSISSFLFECATPASLFNWTRFECFRMTINLRILSSKSPVVHVHFAHPPLTSSFTFRKI